MMSRIMKPGEHGRRRTRRDGDGEGEVGWGEERWGAAPDPGRAAEMEGAGKEVRVERVPRSSPRRSPRRDARPAPPSQAVIVHVGQPVGEEGHREQVHANHDVTWRVQPGMATPARQGDDHLRGRLAQRTWTGWGTRRSPHYIDPITSIFYLRIRNRIKT
jgi:hypothetical protein